MGETTRRLPRGLVAAAATLFGLTLSVSGPALADGWSPQLHIELKPGNERQIGTVELFAPLWQDETSMFFADLRGRYDLEDNGEVNVGLGYRTLIGEEAVLGVYAFFDYLHSEHGNSFIQGSGGVEVMWEQFEIRGNFYIPEDDIHAVHDMDHFDYGSVTVRYGEERALYGGDAEIGFGVPLNEAGNSELRGFVGGYYFDAAGFDKIAGPRARAELRFYDVIGSGSLLTLGAEAQYDDVRDLQAFGIARISIPLGSIFGDGNDGASSSFDRRMTNRIVRDVDIVTNTRHRGEQATFEDGTPISDVIFLNEGGSGDMDGSSPDDAYDHDTYFQSVQSENAVLYVVDGVNGQIESEGAMLLDYDVVLGGDSLFTVYGNGNDGVAWEAPGMRPTIHNDSDGPQEMFILASDNTIKGIDFDITQDVGGGIGEYIAIHGAAGTINRNIVLYDLNFVNSGTTGEFGDQVGGEAIRIMNATDLQIHSVTATDFVGESIDLRNVSGVDAYNVHVAGSGRAGILFGDGSSDISLEHFSIVDSGNIGLGLFNVSFVDVSNGTISGSGQILPGIGQGVNLSNVTDGSFTGLTVSDSTANGFLAVESSNIVLSMSSFTDQTTGVQFQNSSGSITDVGIVNATAQGILLRDDSAVDGFDTNVAINNVTIDAMTPLGVSFIGMGEVTVSGSGNTVDSATTCDVGSPTVTGTVDLNGSPEPGTTC